MGRARLLVFLAGLFLLAVPLTPACSREAVNVQPDRIAFISDRDGDLDIYIMDADGSNIKQLTNTPEAQWNPRWSPDGSKIALVILEDIVDPYAGSAIYTINADGSGEANLTNNSAIDGLAIWSPDGKRIAFNSDRDGNREVYVMNANGSKQTRLTTADDYVYSWSPDGKKIAFASERDGNREIYVMNADGSEQTLLTSNSAWNGLPDWAPRG